MGYFKRKLIGGVLETKVDLWGIRNQIQGVGYYGPISEQGVSSSERLGIEYLKRGFEIRYIVLSQFKRGISDFVSKRKNNLPNLETLKLDGRMNQKRYPRVQEGMFSEQKKRTHKEYNKKELRLPQPLLRIPPTTIFTLCLDIMVSLTERLMVRFIPE